MGKLMMIVEFAMIATGLMVMGLVWMKKQAARGAEKAGQAVDWMKQRDLVRAMINASEASQVKALEFLDNRIMKAAEKKIKQQQADKLNVQ